MTRLMMPDAPPETAAPYRNATHDLDLAVFIRPARASDLPRLEWDGEYTHFREVYRRTYEDHLAGRRLMLVADLNGSPIGQVFLYFAQRWQRGQRVPSYGYFYALRVMAAYRGRGLGTRLIRAVEARLLDGGYPRVSLAVAQENLRARALYERLGYTVYADDPGEWSYVDHEGQTRYVSEPAWLMEKQL